MKHNNDILSPGHERAKKNTKAQTHSKTFVCHIYILNQSVMFTRSVPARVPKTNVVFLHIQQQRCVCLAVLRVHVTSVHVLHCMATKCAAMVEDTVSWCICNSCCDCATSALIFSTWAWSKSAWVCKNTALVFDNCNSACAAYALAANVA